MILAKFTVELLIKPRTIEMDVCVELVHQGFEPHYRIDEHKANDMAIHDSQAFL